MKNDTYGPPCGFCERNGIGEPAFPPCCDCPYRQENRFPPEPRPAPPCPTPRPLCPPCPPCPPPKRKNRCLTAAVAWALFLLTEE